MANSVVSFPLSVEPQRIAIDINLGNPLVAVVSSLMVGLVPIMIGTLMVFLLRGWEPDRRVVLTGIGAGILFSSFYDLTKGTSGLSASTLRSVMDATNIFAFSLALAVFYLYHRSLAEDSPKTIGLSYMWALLGVGFHSFGEGMTIGYDFSTGFTILSLAQVLSFTLHKLGEGLTIGVVMFSSRVRSFHSIFTSMIAGIPVALGTLLGLFGSLGGVSTVSFALASGATVYMVTSLFRREDVKRPGFPFGLLGGFLYMYFAGVLHQFE